MLRKTFKQDSGYGCRRHTKKSAHSSYHTLQSKTVHLRDEATEHLIGCGIDGETIERFSNLSCQDNPYPMVFSTSEINHIKTLAEQADGFCASFCCKEAVFKALGHPFNFTECELFYIPHKDLQHPQLSFSDQTFPIISGCTVRFMRPAQEELVAVAHLYGRRPEWKDLSLS